MIFESENIPNYLFSVLEKRTRTNPRYSQRAFARDLALSPGALSEILHGKRVVTAKFVFKLETALGLSPVEVQHLLGLLQTKKEQDFIPSSRRDMSLQVFRVIADWYHFAILNLMDIKNFRWNASWIGKKIGISFIQAELAMRRLEELEMVESKRGKYSRKEDFIYSTEDVPSEAIRNYHREMLEKSIHALESQPVEERSFLGTGLSISQKDLPKIKKEMSEFHKKILHKYSKKNADSVYHMQGAFFQITKEGFSD